MTPQKMRRNIMIPLGVILVILAGLIMFGFYSSQKMAALSEVELKRDSVANLYKSMVDKEAETMAGLLDLLVGDDRIVGPWLKGDIAALRRVGDPIYQQFNSKYRITHFYFIQNDGTVFMRLHSPERRGDKIKRVTFQGAKRTGRTYYGLEMGPLGTFTLRVVSPVVRNGAVVGYLELGEEVAHLTYEVQRTLGAELLVLVEKRLVQKESWIEGRAVVGGAFVPWEKYSNYVVTGVTAPEFIDLALPFSDGLVANPSEFSQVDSGHRTFMAGAIPLRDVGQNVVGSMLVFIDETDNIVTLRRMSWLTIVGSLLTAGVIFLFFFYRIGREEAKVKEEHLDEMLEHSRSRMAEQQHFIAELSTARDTIERQSAFLRKILDTVPLPLYYKDRDGLYLGCNMAFERFFGKSAADILGKTVVEVFGTSGDSHVEADSAIFAGRSEITYEARVGDSDGVAHDVLVTKAVFEGEEGGPGGIVAALFDMTEIKSARKKLNDSEQRLRSIFDNARIGITMIEGDGRFSSVNKGFTQLLGYSDEELMQSGFFSLIHPNDREKAESEWDRLRGGRFGQVDFQTRLIAGDGAVVTALVSVSRMDNQADRAFRAVAIFQDQRDRLIAEEARDMLAKAVECADEAIVVTDPQSRILYANPAFERVTGYSVSELVGRTPAVLKSGKHENAFYRDLWSVLNAGEVWRGTFVNRRKDGSLFEEAAAISSVRDAEGKILYFVAVKRDITRELELENSLRHAQKMEAVGTLASGVSHDFNNILHAISGLAQVALVGGRLGPKDRENLELIMDTAARGADLVARILTFSRQNEPERKIIDLNREIAEILKMLSKAVPKDVVFDVALAADLAPVNAAPDQMHQIIMNLCANAWDAMPGGGTIRIRTRNMEWPEELRGGMGESGLGICIELSVGDTGSGIDPKTMERIFDPFFTTKPVGKGTGLGLATVYGIVKSHGGVIQCKSEPGQGTEFTIYLPALADRRKAEKPAEAESSELRGGSETLLLVDDDTSILRTTTELLISFGYRVLCASSGEEALEVFEKCGGEIGLTIMDLGMPGMGGRKCLAEVTTRYPGAKVLIASGYDASEEKSCEGAAGYLRKPFRMRDLLAEIRRIMESV